jgi:hypothetical protein
MQALEGMTRRRRRAPAFPAVVVALALIGVGVTAQMPDLRQMAGQPLPSADLPAGTIVVRVVRETIANNIPGVEVELVADGGGAAPRRARTDDSGRATFTDVTRGPRYRVTATVAGERLESRPLDVGPSGGVRVLLAAGLGRGTGPPGQAGDGARPPIGAGDVAPAAPGTITLGGQSRLVVEAGDGIVEVFVLLDLLNTSAAPARLAAPIAFEAPPGAGGLSVLEGSGPLAKAEGNRIIVAGPVPPGTSPVHFAYRLPAETGAVRVRQRLPLAGSQRTVIVRRLDGLEASIEGERNRREVALEGRRYLVLHGGPHGAGDAIEVALEGLPAYARWPRYLALSVCALIVALGVWFALRLPHTSDVEEVQRLTRRRSAAFSKLVELERNLQRGAPETESLRDRREALYAEIEALDAALGDLREAQHDVSLQTQASGDAVARHDRRETALHAPDMSAGRHEQRRRAHTTRAGELGQTANREQRHP